MQILQQFSRAETVEESFCIVTEQISDLPEQWRSRKLRIFHPIFFSIFLITGIVKCSKIRAKFATVLSSKYCKIILHRHWTDFWPSRTVAIEKTSTCFFLLFGDFFNSRHREMFKNPCKICNSFLEQKLWENHSASSWTDFWPSRTVAIEKLRIFIVFFSIFLITGIVKCSKIRAKFATVFSSRNCRRIILHGHWTDFWPSRTVAIEKTSHFHPIFFSIFLITGIVKCSKIRANFATVFSSRNCRRIILHRHWTDFWPSRTVAIEKTSTCFLYFLAIFLIAGIVKCSKIRAKFATVFSSRNCCRIILYRHWTDFWPSRTVAIEKTSTFSSCFFSIFLITGIVKCSKIRANFATVFSSRNCRRIILHRHWTDFWPSRTVAIEKTSHFHPIFFSIFLITGIVKCSKIRANFATVFSSRNCRRIILHRHWTDFWPSRTVAIEKTSTCFLHFLAIFLIAGIVKCSKIRAKFATVFSGRYCGRIILHRHWRDFWPSRTVAIEKTSTCFLYFLAIFLIAGIVKCSKIRANFATVFSSRNCRRIILHRHWTDSDLPEQ